MRIVKVFWSLDASLAYRRHFPAIHWLNSYSLYLDSLRPWFDEHLGQAFMQNRDHAMHLLQEENELNEIVQLVGKDSLSPNDQLTLEVTRMLCGRTSCSRTPSWTWTPTPASTGRSGSCP